MAYHFLVGNNDTDKTPEIVVNGTIKEIIWNNEKFYLFIDNMMFERGNVSFSEFADIVNVLRYNTNIYIKFDKYIDFNRKEDFKK